MIPLLSAEGRRELRRLADTRTLYAFDFDGTLAPIVSDPAAARAPDEVLGELAMLAARAPVVVISGRSCADLSSRVPVKGAQLIGNHGNEGLSGGPDLQQLHETTQQWRKLLDRELSADRFSGVLLEDKGSSLSLHFRATPSPASALSSLRELTGRLQPPPEIIDGKMVLNLLPPGSVTKYEALVELTGRERADAVLFIGDDVTDEVVFARAPAHWTTVRVEPAGPSGARFSLDPQREIGALLRLLTGEFSPSSRRQQAARQ